MLRHRRDVFQGIRATEGPPGVAVAAVVAVVAAAVADAATVARKSAEYSAFAFASESPAAQVCGDGAGADRALASNMLTSPPSIRRKAHKEESAPLSRPAIKHIYRLKIIARMR